MWSALCKATISLALRPPCWASLGCGASEHYFCCREGEKLTGAHSPIDSLNLVFFCQGEESSV